LAIASLNTVVIYLIATDAGSKQAAVLAYICQIAFLSIGYAFAFGADGLSELKAIRTALEAMRPREISD